MQTILVAGGAGFIGSHLCKRLLDEQYFVICIDNLVSGDKTNISGLLENSTFEYKEHDVTQPFNTDKKLDCIFHLASPASPNKRSKRSYLNHPLDTLRANSVGTYELLELAKKNGASFLFASSSEIYGDPSVSPQGEGYFGNVNPVGLRSVYDEGKRFGEACTMAYVRTFGCNGRIVRIFNTYGPNMQADDGRVVSNFITQALRNEPITIYGDGRQTRSFSYVDDTVEGLIKALFTKKTEGQVFNIGNPNEKTILELATIIQGMTNSSSEIVFEEVPEDDPRRRRPDISKAKSFLQWEPKVSLEDGLLKTIEYFKRVL